MGESSDQMMSRRALLGASAVIASLVAYAMPAAADVAKASQKEAAYQDHPKDKEAMCAACKFFQPPNSCQVVQGTISPAGWCQRFEKRA